MQGKIVPIAGILLNIADRSVNPLNNWSVWRTLFSWFLFCFSIQGFCSRFQSKAILGANSRVVVRLLFNILWRSCTLVTRRINCKWRGFLVMRPWAYGPCANLLVLAKGALCSLPLVNSCDVLPSLRSQTWPNLCQSLQNLRRPNWFNIRVHKTARSIDLHQYPILRSPWFTSTGLDSESHQRGISGKTLHQSSCCWRGLFLRFFVCSTERGHKWDSWNRVFRDTCSRSLGAYVEGMPLGGRQSYNGWKRLNKSIRRTISSAWHWRSAGHCLFDDHPSNSSHENKVSEDGQTLHQPVSKRTRLASGLIDSERPQQQRWSASGRSSIPSVRHSEVPLGMCSERVCGMHVAHFFSRSELYE